MTHYWTLFAEDETTATYKCSQCQQIIIFAKEGYGSPSASPPAVPEDINNYVSVECVIPSRTITKRAYLDRFTLTELGNIIGSTDGGLKVILFKFAQTDTVPLDHPSTLENLQYITALGILAPGRAAEILA